MGLELKEVADILHLSEPEIGVLLEKGDLPYYRIGPHIRFSRSEIEDWVLQNQGLAKKTKTTEKRTSCKGRNQYSLFRALHNGSFATGIRANNKEQFLRAASECLAPSLELDPEIFFELLLEREQLQSTAVNHGFAIPHARDLLLKGKQDQVSLLIAEKPIDFGALDGEPVSVFFFPFASTDSRHLQLLSKIALFVASKELTQLLNNHSNKINLLSAVEKWEKTLSVSNQGSSYVIS